MFDHSILLPSAIVEIIIIIKKKQNKKKISIVISIVISIIKNLKDNQCIIFDNINKSSKYLIKFKKKQINDKNF